MLSIGNIWRRQKSSENLVRGLAPFCFRRHTRIFRGTPKQFNVMILKFQKRLFPAKSHIHNDFFCFFFPLFQSPPQLTHILASLVGMQESSVKARLQLDVSASPHASHRLRCKDVLPGCAGLHISKTQLYPGSLWAEQGDNTTVWHRGNWFWHSLEPFLNHPNLCTEAVQFYLAQLPPHTENPTGRDQAKTGRGVVLWHLSRPHTSENITVAHL